jgi:hypothetical protein
MATRKPPGRRTRPERGDVRFGRTKVSNGSEILPNVDGRTVMAKRAKEIARAIAVDQGDDLPEMKRQYVRHFAVACAMAEQLEASCARGEDYNIAEFGLLCSTMVRLGNRLGINRQAKNITPTLADYFVEATVIKEPELVE